MPQPPMLPTIDWKSLFHAACDYEAWLSSEDNAGNCGEMEQQRKKLVLGEDVRTFLTGVDKKVHIIAIAEAWCGDVVMHVPMIMSLSDSSSKLRVRFIGRQARPDVFARFLTNGGEAIPKFIFLSETFVECGHWGPMPEACKDLIARGKACGDLATARQLVATRYDADPDLEEVASELCARIGIASSRNPGAGTW